MPGSLANTYAQGGMFPDDARYIQAYNTNVLDQLKGFKIGPTEKADKMPAEPLWLGVELEVEPKPEGSNKYVSISAEALKDFAILKYDGSLGEGGFEIVTIPGTLEFHRAAWLPFFEKAAANLRSWTTTDERRKEGRCGVHIHMNIHAISDLTLGKMLLFVNEEYNRKFIEKIAGRGAGTYNNFRKKKIGDGRKKLRDHHEALSISQKNHGKSAELRIFRGNSSKQGLFRYLEFTHALVDFCKVCTADKPNGAQFLQWYSAQENYSRYPYLTRWMRKNKLGDKPMLVLRSKVNPTFENELEAA